MTDTRAKRGVRGAAGGAAAAGGESYEAKVAAWWLARMLAEAPADGVAGVSGTPVEVGRTLDFMGPDDVFVQLDRASGGECRLYAQCKTALRASTSTTSPLAKALSQCVLGYLSLRDAGELDPDRDRFALVVTSRSSAPIKRSLHDLLHRFGEGTDHSAGGAARTAGERAVLKEVIEHVDRVARQETAAWTTADRDSMLRLTRVQVLDLGDDESGTLVARTLLTTGVLPEAETSPLPAWRDLCTIGGALGEERRSVGPRELRRQVSFRLRAPRSVRPRIQRLRERSRSAVAELARHTTLRQPDGRAPLSLPRRYAELVIGLAASGNVAIVGDAGAGKSGVLHDFVALASRDHDVVVALADELTAEEARELSETLPLWPGPSPAFLVVDALDAIRDASAQRRTRRALQAIAEGSRWRLVATVRTFDLEHGLELAELFPGTSNPTNGGTTRLGEVLHVAVKAFTDAELSPLRDEYPELWPLVAGAAPPLRELLRQPFALGLAADLIAGGVRPGTLSGVRTALQLMDRWWWHRVDGPQNGGGRRSLLRHLVDALLEARALRVRCAPLEAEQAYRDLRSDGVLREDAVQRVGFFHHAVFDFAVERLRFRDGGNGLLEALEEQPDLALFARPSVLLHLAWWWGRGEGRRGFWQRVLRMFDADGVPEIGRLAGPMFAAEHAGDLTDLRALLEALLDTGRRPVAARVLARVIGAPSADLRKCPWTGERAGPWCAIAEWLSEHLDVPEARHLLLVLTDSIVPHFVPNMTEDQQAQLGRAARAWVSSLIGAGTPAAEATVACRALMATFATAAREAGEIARRALEDAGGELAFAVLRALADNVVELLPLDPDLVGLGYECAFAGPRPGPDEQRVFGTRIMPFVMSARASHHSSIIHPLVEAYGTFVRLEQALATRALDVAVTAYVQEKQSRVIDRPADPFEFRGSAAAVLEDLSGIWDQGEYPDDTRRLLDAWEDGLVELAMRTADVGTVLDQIRECRPAAIWTRLLRAGTREPDRLGARIAELAMAAPLLFGSSHSVMLGFLTAIAPHVSEETWRGVEAAVISAPDALPNADAAVLLQYQCRILSRLAPPLSTEGQRLLDEASVREAAQRSEAASAPPTRSDEDDLALMVADLFDSWPHVDLERSVEGEAALESLRELRGLRGRYAPDGPPLAVAVQASRTASEVVEQVRATGDAALVREAWGTLADAMACVARVTELASAPETLAAVRRLLLEAARQPWPQPDAHDAAAFDRGMATMGARSRAAEGLAILAARDTTADEEILEAVEQLARDPVPGVRGEVVARAAGFRATDADRMWRVLERAATTEVQPGILEMLSVPLTNLALGHPQQVGALVAAILTRAATQEDPPGALSTLVRLAGTLSVRGVSTEASSALDELIGDPTTNADVLAVLGRHLSPALTAALQENGRRTPEDLRVRAWAIVDHVSGASLKCWEDDASRPALEPVLYDIAFGIHQAAKTTIEEPSAASTLLDEGGSTICRLVAVPLTPRTGHEVVEAICALRHAHDPRVFLWLASAVDNTVAYDLEPPGARAVAAFVESALADQRDLLLADQRCRDALIQTLDRFVDRGWPQAFRIVGLLDSLYR